MIVMSHRGYWKDSAEKNQAVAFERSFSLGFGTETDVRDSSGRLVISHDMPTGGEMTLEALLDLLGPADLPLALNIKADGLAGALRDMMRGRPQRAWFVFDMSVPDMRSHLAVGNPVFTRVSEVESEPSYYERCRGVWLDAFEQDAWRAERIPRFVADGKQVCIVSPELHGREPAPFWEALRTAGPAVLGDDVLLCTDLPEQARDYFGASR